LHAVIDTAAHEASLETGTIAVIATGLDINYPPENADLQRAISQTGCVVSEMVPGTQPRADLFPRRNRIIAGLAAGVVVVEAALRSGSLITAHLANELGREVFAVPGAPYDPRSEGTNRLIRDGATLVMSAADVLETLQHDHFYDQLANAGSTRFSEPSATVEIAQHTPVPEDDHRKAIVSLLGPNPVDVDTVIREAGLPARLVQMVLVELDVSGRLERHPGQRVSLLL
jgi:DNA processing protein